MKKTLLVLMFSLGLAPLAQALDATYTVPETNSATSTNPTSVELVQDATGTEIKYKLPEDLVGQNAADVQMNLVARAQTDAGPMLKF